MDSPKLMLRQKLGGSPANCFFENTAGEGHLLGYVYGVFCTWTEKVFAGLPLVPDRAARMHAGFAHARPPGLHAEGGVREGQSQLLQAAQPGWRQVKPFTP